MRHVLPISQFKAASIVLGGCVAQTEGDRLCPRWRFPADVFILSEIIFVTDQWTFREHRRNDVVAIRKAAGR
jgi:hypothetical protein